MSRIVCQFSCGAASAVATKLALAQYGRAHDVQIINEGLPSCSFFCELAEQEYGA